MPKIEIMASAKINLGLHVLRRREDGYHDISTVFLQIGWVDDLRISLTRPAESPGLSMTCSEPGLPIDNGNLCVRAARALTSRLGVHDAQIGIHLEKWLASGAGLGGGSSDAAATLTGLSRLLEADIPAGTAESIGADVAFFLDLRPSLGTGRGDDLVPLEGYRFPFYLVVVVPDIAVSTAEAYARVKPNDVDRPDLETVVRSNDPTRWTAELVNDFEPSIFALYPRIAALKERFLTEGADYASLSGSGSAVFGVFTDTDQAYRAAMNLCSNTTRVFLQAPGPQDKG